MTTATGPIPLVDPEVACRLPSAYLSVLHGVASGEDDRALAARAEVEPAAVPWLIRLALAKLLEVQRDVRIAQEAT